jgi:hypothetical protein
MCLPKMFSLLFRKVNGLFKKRVVSIRRKLIVNYSTLISLLVTIIVMVNVYITTNIMMNNISYYMEQTINEASNKINVALRNIEEISDIIVSNKQILRTVMKYNQQDQSQGRNFWSAYEEREEINSVLSDFSIPWTHVHSIGIYYNEKDAHFFGGMGDKRLYNLQPVESQFHLIDESPKSMVWIPSYHLNFNVWLFSLVRNLVDVKT